MFYKDFLQYSNNLSILFVENNDRDRKEFSNILKLFFHKVDVARDGFDGVDQYREFHNSSNDYYDIVITETDMPTMDGEEFIKQIKLLKKDQNFVVISKTSEVDALINFINLGVKNFLQKPLTSSEFQESLYELSKNIAVRKNPHIKYEPMMKNIVEPDNSIDFLRCDDSICLSKVI